MPSCHDPAGIGNFGKAGSGIPGADEVAVVIEYIDTPAGIGLEYLAVQDNPALVQVVQLFFRVCQNGLAGSDSGQGPDVRIVQLGVKQRGQDLAPLIGGFPGRGGLLLANRSQGLFQLSRQVGGDPVAQVVDDWGVCAGLLAALLCQGMVFDEIILLGANIRGGDISGFVGDGRKVLAGQDQDGQDQGGYDEQD